MASDGSRKSGEEGPTHGDASPRLISPTLIGRDREHAALREAISAPAALVRIEGEAGIGKSRLVREALAHPAPVSRRILHGYCHRLRDPFLLGPIVEALRRVGDAPPSRPLSPLVGALRPLLPELAEVLPPPPAPIGDARAERHRVFRALRELLSALGPTVCVLEDLHWADEGTLEFLAFLLSEPPRAVVLVITYRGEDLPASSPMRTLGSRMPDEAVKAGIELAGLPVEEVRRLGRAILGAKLGEEFASTLHRWTAGNPLAVEELLRMLRDRDQLVLRDGQLTSAANRIDVPPTIRESIRQRVGELDGDGRLVTRSAAVLAVPVENDLLTRVAGLPPARGSSGLAQGVSSGLIEEQPDGRVAFRHALAAEAVHADIPASERRRLHLRAARTLEARPEPVPLARLAHHFREAKLGARWPRYAEAAADAAISMGNDREAARLLEEALAAPRLSRAARIRMATKLGTAALYSVVPNAAIDLLGRTLEEETMPRGSRGELRWSLARLQSHAGEASWREGMVRAVGELARRPDLAAQAMVSLAWPSQAEGELEEDLGWLRRAVAAAARADDPDVARAVARQRAVILLSVGDPTGWDAAAEIFPQAGSPEEKSRLLRAYHGLSVVTMNLGHYRRADSFLAEAVRIDDELEHTSWAQWLETTRVALDWRTGRWEGLESRARGLAEATRARPALSMGNELVLGSLLLARSRVDEAEQIFAAALELARPRRWMAAQVAASSRLARIHLARGDAQAAREITSVGLAVVRQKGTWVWARDLAPLAVAASIASDLPQAARELSEEFAAGLCDRDAPAARAASAMCQGALAESEGRHSAAARSLSRAERLWRELPCPYDAAQAREQRAHCMLAQEDRRGSDLLLGALEAFEGLGASWDTGRVRAELRGRGVAQPGPALSARKSYGHALSPREAEVARLAGMGKKNREIAESLFLSRRTVEAHVASVLRKLGVDSRQALASVTHTDE